MRVYIGLVLLWGCAWAQNFQRNRISASGGWGEQLNVYPTDRQTAPVLGGSYGYRPLRFVELEAGVLGALQPGLQVCNAHGCVDPDDRYIWVPFGVRFVAPFRRAELSVGGGGLYEKYSVSNSNSGFFFERSGWGGYVLAGAVVGVSKHWWVGATPRLVLANPQYARDRWFLVTGDVSWRW